jgi:hypothetical protein
MGGDFTSLARSPDDFCPHPPSLPTPLPSLLRTANLKLERYHTAPSRATLYHWGNTSSSSIWYELRYCEGENDRRKGGAKGAAGAGAGVDEAKAAAASMEAAAAKAQDLVARIERLTAAKETEAAAAAAEATSGGAGSRATPSSSSARAAATPTAAAGTPARLAASGAAGAAGNDNVPEGWDPARKWYLPEYRSRHVQPGERILQIAFGSGFKCNSAVWLRMR